MRLGFRLRLILWHAVSTIVLLAILVTVADWALSRLIRGHVDSVLLTRADTEAATAFDRPPGVHLHKRQSIADQSGHSWARLERLIQIVAWDGTVMARSGTLGESVLPAPDALLDRVRAGETVIETITLADDTRVRLVTTAVPDESRPPYALQLGAPLQSVDAFLTMARWLMFGISALLLQAVVVLGAVLTRRALRPIDEMVAMANRIGGETRGRRLPHPGTDDEIGRLVSTLNEMLERLDRRAEAHRRFTADAAHELRTPLSRMCAELEIALRRPRDAEHYEEVVRSSLDEAERLSKLTGMLLTLARLDAGEAEGDTGVAATDVLEVAQAECSRERAEADRRGIEIVLEPAPSMMVAVPPASLSLLLGNLINNAVKFSPPGGRVIVNADAGNGEAMLAVADAGPGIPAEQHEKVFERFFRADTSRSPQTPGHGLGLSICRAIVETYGGTIRAEPGAEEGNVFTVRLPLAREPREA